MVLITSSCVVELYFFFMNFNKGAADIVYYDLEVQNRAHAQSNLRIALFKMTKNSHSIFIKMKISFLHDIP